MIKKKLPVYYHNPRCSKSRQGKELLELKKISFDIKEYLKTSFEKEELLSLFTKLDKKPIVLYFVYIENETLMLSKHYLDLL